MFNRGYILGGVDSGIVAYISLKGYILGGRGRFREGRIWKFKRGGYSLRWRVRLWECRI